MFIELLSEFLNEFSPIYIYLSLLISVLHFEFGQLNEQNRLFKNDWYAQKSNTLQFQMTSFPEMNVAAITIRNWIANKTKRIETPDDDKEDSSFSIFYSTKNRGGQKWKQHLYSPNLRIIA
ncbi:hypothetical protein [Oceanobacillus saliphilus]|uniref:hypothetical protein n=1 Tax=Oceanobacillus saliphilus TaxID=2925834 RepID=UPI00201D52EA|nr:hypothetical protein [Oceanobacillus saliphilus]